MGGEAVERPVQFQEVFATHYQNLGIDVKTATVTDLTGRPRFLGRCGAPADARINRIIFMKWIFTVGCFASLAVPGYGALEIEPKEVATLRGPDARLQVVVTQDGADATRAVEYRVEPAGALQVDAAGHVKPLLNGAAKVIAQCEGEAAVEVDVLVESLEEAPPINFKNQIVRLSRSWVVTVAGATVRWRGRTGSGCPCWVRADGGLRVSRQRGARGGGFFPAAPEYSLLLRKATGELPHGGGGRLERDTPAYQKIVRWIEQGMPYGLESDPFVEKVEVFSKERMLEAGDFQQLRVTAFYSDGTTEDVTRVVSYEANVPEMAECSPEGLVEAGSMTGSVAVMVRFHEAGGCGAVDGSVRGSGRVVAAGEGDVGRACFCDVEEVGGAAIGAV